MVDALSQGSTAIRQNYGNIVTDLDAVRTNLPDSDMDAALRMIWALERDPSTPLFVGSDSHQRVIFSNDTIRSFPILNPDGETIGATFPSHATDNHLGPPRWSRAGLDRVHQRYGVTSNAGQVSQWKQILGLGRSAPAPWAENAKTETMLFSDAHGQPFGYEVGVVTEGEVRVVGVDGGNFGRVLATNPHIQRALDNHPVNLLLQLSCDPAAGPAAKAAADALHEASIGTDVWASKHQVDVYIDDSHRPVIRGLSVQPEPRSSEDHWAVYRAPPDS
ncbi:hypothetical protein ACLMAJ_10720 [Nocardia sp. KC 131]|uniref:hypothetical protein n=1 Tax=Nocardia arseniciresistens TaxID=3392119 RepID=UPI00398F395A